MTKSTAASDREIKISRVIDAPRERVWRALTDPQEVDAWWGPDGFKNATTSWSFKPGGVWKHVMIGPDGAEYPTTTKFVEIVEPERIVYGMAGGKKGGRGVSFLMTWTLKDLGAKTELTIHQVFESADDRDFVANVHRAVEGGQQTLRRLDEHVKAAKPAFELNMSRVVDAPRARVFEAWSKPEQVKRWFAPRPWSLDVEKMDFRSGGGFKMAMVSPGGDRHDFAGAYAEVVAPERIVWTGEFPGDPAGNMRTEIVFKDRGRRTEVVVRQTFAVLTPINEGPTQGAQQGWTKTLDQLTEFVERQ